MDHVDERDLAVEKEWRQDREKPAHARKDRKRWCGGKVGREHTTVIAVPENAFIYGRVTCRWAPWSTPFYACRHVELCTTCGKHVRPFLEPAECPDYPGPREEDA